MVQLAQQHLLLGERSLAFVLAPSPLGHLRQRPDHPLHPVGELRQRPARRDPAHSAIRRPQAVLVPHARAGADRVRDVAADLRGVLRVDPLEIALDRQRSGVRRQPEQRVGDLRADQAQLLRVELPGADAGDLHPHAKHRGRALALALAEVLLGHVDQHAIPDQGTIVAPVRPGDRADPAHLAVRPQHPALDVERRQRRRRVAVARHHRIEILVMNELRRILGRIVMADANAEALFGYDRGELEGQPVEILLSESLRPDHPRLRPDHGENPNDHAMGYGRELCVRRKDGSELPAEIGFSPFEGPEGPMTIAALVDIRARKLAEAQRELLVGELNHRVKNTLAVVQAIAHQTFKASGASDACRAFEGRVAALARANDRLTRASWESASLDQLAADALQVHGPQPHRVVLDGPNSVLLEPKQALSITLALHELFTNATKHGALSTEGGRVRLTWEQVGRPERRLRLIWREEGGPPVAAPARRGFGLFMIERTLAQDLGGSATLDYAAGGLVCTIEAPLPARGPEAP